MIVTLANLHEATAQQVFDQVKNHLLKQKKVSSDEEGTNCLYRAGNLKCAAGCLITDKEYKSEYEKKSWSVLVKAYGIPSNHSRLIEDLQHIHDFLIVDEWEQKLKELSDQYNLNF